MFKFEKEQKIIQIGKVKIGGQPGELPTVLIGSIFYDGDKAVKDPRKGIFDKDKEESRIKDVEEWSAKTGNPFILDVVGESSEALIKYVDFVVETTEYPFLMDGITADIRIPVLKHVAEAGLLDRAVYNSIDPHFNEKEKATIIETGLKNSVILVHSSRAIWSKQRIELLTGTESQEGLISIAEKAGIENMLIDTAVLDLPSISISARACHLVKETFGLPTGCGPTNAIYTWDAPEKLGKNARDWANISTSVTTLALGADFLLYGPLGKAKKVFPAIGAFDAIQGYLAMREYKIKFDVKEHPLRKIFQS